LVSAVLVAAMVVFTVNTTQAQDAQSGSSNKPQSSSTPPPVPSQANTNSTPSTTPAKTQTTQPKAGGMVWVNTQTGTYHKQGTRWYGKTKQGKYMLEEDAIKAGYK